MHIYIGTILGEQDSKVRQEHPAPLKLRPYGAIQICLLLLLLLTAVLRRVIKQLLGTYSI